MQPGPPPDFQQPRPAVSQPAAGWPPAWGQHGPRQPGPGAATPPAQTRSAAPQPRAGRPGLVALVAVLIEVIVIAAADNQWVAERVSDAALDHPDSLGYDASLALLTFQWRF